MQCLRQCFRYEGLSDRASACTAGLGSGFISKNMSEHTQNEPLTEGYRVCWVNKSQPLEMSDRDEPTCSTELNTKAAADAWVEKMNKKYPSLIHFSQWDSARLMKQRKE